MKFQQPDIDEISVVEVGISGKNTTTTVRTITTDENNDF